MELNWLGNHRGIIGDFYRSANGYSQICKTELFGDKIRFSPYEVQIMEHIMEHADDNRNMKWYAQQLGLSQATYSKYVTRLVKKGLVDKYHTEDNQKNVILRISSAGMEEYRKYARRIHMEHFSALLEYLDTLSPDQLTAVRETFAILGQFHGEGSSGDQERSAVRLIKIRDGIK